MSFLAPLPAIIAASIAVPTLIAFYLLKLRRRPVRVSSTMLWDQAVQDLQANVPLKWLRPSWLLLLHLLILAALLLALARPVVDVGSTRADRIILLIDRSASMSARDAGEAGDRARFEVAIERARGYIDSLRSGGFSGQVVLIAYAHEARVVAGPTGDLRRIGSALTTLEPTDQPGDPAAALRVAEAIAQQQREEDAPVERALTILYTDGGDAIEGSLAIAGSEVRFERIGPAPRGGTRGQDSGDPAGHDNLGIVALSARRAYDDPDLIRVFTRVQNALAREVSATVMVRGYGETLRRSALTIPPASPPEAGERGAGLEPGQESLSFALSEPDGLLLELAIARSDILDADDQAWLAVPPAARASVLLVRPGDDGGGGEEGDGSGEGGSGSRPTDWILDDVLAELDLRALRRMTAREYAAAGEGAHEDADLVIFEGVTPDEPPPIPSLSFGAGLPMPGLGLGEPGGDGEGDEAGASTYILNWSRDHPLLRDVALDAVRVADSKVVEGGEGVESLARGSYGMLMAMDERAGTPHVVVAFDLARSNWRLSVGFAIFMARAVDSLSEQSQPVPSDPLTTSEPISLRPASGASAIEVRGPGGERVARIPRGQWPDRGPVPLGVMRRVGVHEVSGGEADRLGINLLSPVESALGTRESLSISGTRVEGEREAGERPVEIWHWFVLAAAALLALEWVIYAARMRV